MHSESEPQLLFKFILIGDIAVGKSSLLKQFVESKFQSDYNITIGVEFNSKVIQIDDQPIKLQIWDTSGQECFQSVTRLYYRAAAGAIMVYDITRRDTFDNIRNWFNEASENGNPKMQFLLIGNKTDLQYERQVEQFEAQQFANETGCLFIETSAMEGYNVENAFLQLAHSINTQIIDDPELIKENYGIKVLKNSTQNSRFNGHARTKEDVSMEHSQQMKKPVVSNSEYNEYFGEGKSLRKPQQQQQQSTACGLCCLDQ